MIHRTTIREHEPNRTGFHLQRSGLELEFADHDLHGGRPVLRRGLRSRRQCAEKIPAAHSR